MKQQLKNEGKFLTSTDGSKIYYETFYTATAKSTLILLHGATGDASTWNEFRDLLHKHGYSTIAIDLRGHGFSDRSHRNEFYEVDRIIDDVFEIVKAENVKKFILIGQCYGGTVLTKAATKRPEGLHALVVINSSYKSGMIKLYKRVPFRKQLLALIEKLPNIGKAGQTDFTKYKKTGNFHLPRIAVTTWRATLKSVLFTFDKVFTLNVEDELGNINVPVCIIGGTKDVFFPEETIHALAEKLKGPTVCMIEGDHIMCLNQPEEVTSMLVQFLEKVHT
jgi:pimeloyl-ACP methyl ester carboxylesterase